MEFVPGKNFSQIGYESHEIPDYEFVNRIIENLQNVIIKTRNGERNDEDLRIAQSVRRASTRYSTVEPATYFSLQYMKIRPLISLIRQDLSYLVIRVVYLHMPLLNMEC
jgi:DNA polymerase elongation subunit (family B)